VTGGIAERRARLDSARIVRFGARPKSHSAGSNKAPAATDNAVTSTLARVGSNGAGLHSPGYNIDLNGHVLSIGGNVFSGVRIADSEWNAATSRVVLTGNGQVVEGIETQSPLDVTGPDVHIAGDCDACFGHIGVFGNIAVSGKLTLDEGAYLFVASSEAGNADLLVSGQVFAMPYSEMDIGRDIQVSGSSALLRSNGGDIEVNRDILASNAGTVDIGPCAYIAAYRDFITASNGLLKMQAAEAGLDVFGNMHMDGASTVGMITNGYTYIYGDLSATGTGFAPSGPHETSFGEYYEQDHTVSFSQSGTGSTGSHFARLYLYDDNLTSSTPLFIDGDGLTFDDEYDSYRVYDLHACGTLTAPAVTVAGSIYLCNGSHLQTAQTTLQGPDGTIDIGYGEPLTTNLVIEGTARISYLELVGNLTVTGSSASLVAGDDGTISVDGSVTSQNSASIMIDNYATVNVTGDVTTETGGTLGMQQYTSLNVSGNVFMNGGVSHWDGGQLQIGGNLSASGFGIVSDAEHQLSFTGGDGSAHTISLPRDGSNAYLNALGSLVVYGNVINIDHSLHLIGNLTAHSGESQAKFVNATGSTVVLRVEGFADISGATFQDVALDIDDNHNSEYRSDVNNVTFTEFTSAIYQLTLHMDQDTTSFNILTIAFDEVAEASHGYNFVDLFGHDVTLNLNGATHGGSPAFPSGSQLAVEDAVSNIVWNPS
jgi:hypothetical protein